MKRLVQGFTYALLGLKLSWKEANFKIEIACAVIALAFGLFLHISLIEFAIIILVIGAVLAAETFNTALEELCDKFQPTHDSHIAKIKDLAAAAVLLTSAGALIVGILIFVPHL
ncbi:MAG: diacylglycerol kinase [Minisyncoccota bacterium]